MFRWILASFFLVFCHAAELTPPPPPVEHVELPSSAEATESYQDTFIRMVFSLAGLLVLVVGTFWFLRRMNKGKFRSGSSQTLHILEKKPLSPKTMLYLIEIEGRQVLLAESQLEVRALTTIHPPEDPQDDP
jgi:flagellar protein FliO/FliZ